MLKLRDLHIKYPDGTEPISGISLSLADGESVALIGENGAGKTTLLLSLVGVLPLSCGSVTVGDIQLTTKNLDAVRERIGMVFQNPDDQLFMPVIMDDVMFGPHNFGRSKEEIDRLASETLKLLGIAHLKERSTLKLSGGEKRLAAISTVLVMEPCVMLLDEPTAFLDPKARRNLINVLSRLPHTKLIATHDLTFAHEVCERVVIMKGGRIAADGTPRELLFDEELMERCGLEAIGKGLGK